MKKENGHLDLADAKILLGNHNKVIQVWYKNRTLTEDTETSIWQQMLLGQAPF